ncbi:hypothetical protein E2C01_085329 [Portunus trituberculatus]|uniref:Uncharacterized protein n=1 Tax=Portunus trituberculatus TaxID=210409 RepID=A0A5B7J6G7_PORTR|nr:hypothetical protein [Portunus trituberculatus]
MRCSPRDGVLVSVLALKPASHRSLRKDGAKASSKASWYRSLMVGGAKASSKPHGTEASWSSSRSFKPPLKKTPPVHSSPSPTSPIKCHGNGKLGHIRPRCPKNPRAFKESPPSQPFTVGFCLSDHHVPRPLLSGTVNGSWTSYILRNTVCSCIVDAEEVLPDADISNCRSCQVADYLGRVDTFPIVQCYIRYPYFEGWIGLDWILIFLAPQQQRSYGAATIN